MPVAPSGSLGTEQEEFGWATPAGGGGGVNVVVLRWQVFPDPYMVYVTTCCCCCDGSSCCIMRKHRWLNRHMNGMKGHFSIVSLLHYF